MASSASVPAALGDDAQATAAAEELLRAMESYQPIVPDAVTQYYLGLSGYQCNDPRVTRLASLAAHKFVADLTNDALRICKQKQQKGRLTLTTEDLIVSAREYGITIRKPIYFAGMQGAPALVESSPGFVSRRAIILTGAFPPILTIADGDPS
jgi:transcription initiation factor TFIID subunit 10